MMEGMNSRLDALQAAVLTAKLPYLDDWTRRRQENAGYYDELLANVDGIERPLRRAGASHVYHLYVVQVDQRSEVQLDLKGAGVESAVHYPAALPFLPAYARFGHVDSDFPRARRNQDRILSLPMYAELTRPMIEHVAKRADHRRSAFPARTKRRQIRRFADCSYRLADSPERQERQR